MIAIRPLVSCDAEQFKSLRILATEDSPTSILSTREEEVKRSLEQTVDRIRETHVQAVFGAFDGETLIGITGLRREPLHQASHKATIWGVFVNPSFRGLGIAETLLAAATAHAAEKWNTIQLMLCVNAENVAAKNLYASNGFQSFGLEPRAMQVNGRFYDEVHMCKSLE
jgi:RimJ/RimL family protein N-acetyltransferase